MDEEQAYKGTIIMLLLKNWTVCLEEVIDRNNIGKQQQWQPWEVEVKVNDIWTQLY